MYIWISSSALMVIGRIRSPSNFLTNPNDSHWKPITCIDHCTLRTQWFFGQPLPHIESTPRLVMTSSNESIYHRHSSNTPLYEGFVGVRAYSGVAPCFEDLLADPNIGRFLKHDGSSLAPPLKAILARAEEMAHSFRKKMVVLSAVVGSEPCTIPYEGFLGSCGGFLLVPLCGSGWRP